MATDPDFQLFKLTNDNRVIQVQSPLSTKYIAGHVNDDVLSGNFGKGSNSLIFIDHGREPQDLQYSQWERSYLWRIDKVNNNWVASEFAQSLDKKFWHSSSNPLDINNDGLLDFSVAALSAQNNVLFLSNSKGSYDSIDLTQPFDSSCGSSALIRLVKNKFGSICLPYTPSEYTLAEKGFVHTLSIDGRSILSTKSVTVRGSINTPNITAVEGYNLIKVLDLNKDGLEDFIAVAESRDGSNAKTKKLIAFIQNANGDFFQANQQLGIKFDYSLPNSSTDYYTDWIESKVLLIDANGDGVKDILIPSGLILHKELISKGIRGGYVFNNGNYVDLIIPSSKIIFNSEPSPYNYRFILPMEINNDGIVDFLLISSTFDQPKTISNPYGQIFHLTILSSEIQN